MTVTSRERQRQKARLRSHAVISSTAACPREAPCNFFPSWLWRRRHGGEPRPREGPATEVGRAVGPAHESYNPFLKLLAQKSGSVRVSVAAGRPHSRRLWSQLPLLKTTIIVSTSLRRGQRAGHQEGQRRFSGGETDKPSLRL